MIKVCCLIILCQILAIHISTDRWYYYYKSITSNNAVWCWDAEYSIDNKCSLNRDYFWCCLVSCVLCSVFSVTTLSSIFIRAETLTMISVFVVFTKQCVEVVEVVKHCNYYTREVFPPPPSGPRSCCVCRMNSAFRPKTDLLLGSSYRPPSLRSSRRRRVRGSS